MRLERLISIVFLLLNRERISSTDLARRFDVSVRTIYRDIQAINNAGIPVIAYTGQNGGFGIIDTYRIDKQVLSLKEMSSIIGTLKGINKTLENPELDMIIEKICDLMPRSELVDNQGHKQQIAIDLLPWGYSESYKKTLKDLNRAIASQVLLEIEYIKPDHKKDIRTIEPMTMMFKGHTWYLYGYCRLRNSFRLFKLSRIEKYSITENPFIRRNNEYKELEEWTNETKLLNIKLKFSPEIKSKVEDYYRTKDFTVLADDSIIVNLKFPDNDWIHGHILSFGEFVEVLEPLALRDIIAGKAKKIASNYYC